MGGGVAAPASAGWGKEEVAQRPRPGPPTLGRKWELGLEMWAQRVSDESLLLLGLGQRGGQGGGLPGGRSWETRMGEGSPCVGAARGGQDQTSGGAGAVAVSDVEPLAQGVGARPQAGRGRGRLPAPGGPGGGGGRGESVGRGLPVDTGTSKRRSLRRGAIWWRRPFCTEATETRGVAQLVLGRGKEGQGLRGGGEPGALGSDTKRGPARRARPHPSPAAGAPRPAERPRPRESLQCLEAEDRDGASLLWETPPCPCDRAAPARAGVGQTQVR